ncbi:hypothetical protein [Candidatus Electrothrix sp.]|uniref:hypothetical protein n=1 Tax=Candidatus Electrothrix sp. TaxID=2170559 RepID=UPI0040564198
MIIKCPICRTPVPAEQYNTDSLCPGCSAPLHCTAYPALLREQKVIHPEQVEAANQASCFYHPEKQAVVDCSHCGRFLCALCDLDMGASHICPVCLERGKDKQGVIEQKQGCVRYDILVLALAFWPFLLIIPLTVLTAPLTLYLIVKYHKTPISITPVSRWRFPMATLLATAQIIGIGLVVYLWPFLLT